MLTDKASDPVEYRATVRALRLTAERALAAHAEPTSCRGAADAGGGDGTGAAGPAWVGPITAPQVLISWSHPGRLRSEAAFAMLAGVAPLPASSGRVVRHRLHRGGDRQLNRALHTIVMLHASWHEPTTRDLPRRTAEGKSRRDAKRCLRRVIARQLFRLLERKPGHPIAARRLALPPTP